MRRSGRDLGEDRLTCGHLSEATGDQRSTGAPTVNSVGQFDGHLRSANQPAADLPRESNALRFAARSRPITRTCPRRSREMLPAVMRCSVAADQKRFAMRTKPVNPMIGGSSTLSERKLVVRSTCSVAMPNQSRLSR